MASFAKISVRMAMDLKGFSSQMQNVQRDMKKMGAQMTKVGAGLTLGLTAPLAALGAVAVSNFDKQAKAIAQVETGLKTTQNAVGITSTELQKMASELQNNSLFGDEEILQGATAQLLTFTNIAGEQFKRTQQAALDLATRLDGDLKSSAIQLGKALNDPVANLSALSKSGIQFSKEQKTTINALVATNKLAEAQTLILDELEKQYGGSAAAAAKAGSGGLKQLQNILGDLTEDFGKMILEAINPFIEKLKGMALAFQDLSPSAKKFIAISATLAAAIGPVMVALGFLMTTIIPGLIPLFIKLNAVLLANPWGLLAAAVGLAIGAYLAFNNEADKTAKNQNIISQVSKIATEAIAKEKAEVEKLLFVARDEQVSKEQRLKAIQELNRISPKYLGNLNLETINTDKARIAVEQYNDALISTAKAKAAQAKLQEIQAKIIDKELELSARRKAVIDAESDAFKGAADNASAAETAERNLNLAKVINKLETENGTKALKEQAAALIEIINLNGIISSTSVTPNGFNKRKPVTPIELPKISGVIISPLAGIAASIPTETQLIKDELAGLEGSMIDIGSAINGALGSAIANTAQFFGEFLGNLASGNAGAEDLFKGLLGIVAGFMDTLGQALIAAGIASEAFKKLLGSGWGAIAAGAALIALAAVVKTTISGGLSGKSSGGGVGVPALASGGIVYNPTLAYVGEYAGASSNPEVIAPLDKLKSLIMDVIPQGSGVGLIGDFKLRGADLLMSVTRADVAKKRRG